MRLGLNLGYSGARLSIDIDLVRHAEDAGFDSVWAAESYGSDAITPLAWIAGQTSRIKLGTAIMQMPSRSPALAAMTAISLDHLSNGRFVLGIGPSGPQVVEGWHGVAYGKPLTRTREYISIIRDILSREAPVEHKGELYSLPYQGPGASGLGRPLKSIIHGRSDMEILTAAIGPSGVACSAEVADGLIPVWMNPERFDLFGPALEEGFAAASGPKGLDRFRIAPFVICVVNDDLEVARMPVKHMLALYIGGMGAKGKNFYTDYAKRMGYEEAAEMIQDLYLAGDKAAAVAAVPDALADEVSLVGPADRIRERLSAWKNSPVTDMLVLLSQRDAVDVLAAGV